MRKDDYTLWTELESVLRYLTIIGNGIAEAAASAVQYYLSYLAYVHRHPPSLTHSLTPRGTRQTGNKRLAVLCRSAAGQSGGNEST